MPSISTRRTGQLQTKDPLDHEEKDTYTVEVLVSEDGGNPGQKGARGLRSPGVRGVSRVRSPVTRRPLPAPLLPSHVEDQNEPPEITGPPSVDYAESGEEDVATYTASDPEEATITWSLLPGDDADLFSDVSIDDGDDGVLKVHRLSELRGAGRY